MNTRDLTSLINRLPPLDLAWSDEARAAWFACVAQLWRQGETMVKEIAYVYPLRPDYLAQLVLPADLSEEEARRLGAFLLTLVVPKQENTPQEPSIERVQEEKG